METTTIIEELVQAARALGLEVRSENGNFRGGRCTVDGETIIMLNKRHLPETRLRVLANALRDAPMDTVYLKPAVREALEDAWNDPSEETAHVDD